MALKIGELASELNTTTKTIRHYERVGLLKQPLRSKNGYRYYDDNALARAKIVFGLRQLGFSIPQVKSLLEEDGKSSLRQRVLGLLDQKLSDIQLTMNIMQGRQEDLEMRYHALLKTSKKKPHDCICQALLVECDCK